MSDADPGLMTVFAEALERIDPTARADYLEHACGDDAALRRRVDALLVAHDGAGRFLEGDPPGASEPTSPETLETTRASVSGTRLPSELATEEARSDATLSLAGAPRPDRPAASGASQVIAGRYTLREILGEGGMGTVYRADQTEPVRRQVALKLIKIGMDSRAVLARFDAERQALALMDHPNIARVYDGGTTATGQPFFVMELVKGEPITAYCDRLRLPVRARLELFVAVCHAVQHAHQKGIIHRDLKPGNVLVTEVDGRPTPKVIDFGVAKATEFKLTDQSLPDTGAIVGTPAYMSPEQADPSSMDIDTRTDIYALGVILYELLAGSAPLDVRQFKRGAILEMLRMVREVDPPRPSTKVSTAEALPSIAASRGIEPAHLKRALQGDLDWIVMKALEKDRTRRYETANGFATDILRHLSYEAVLAAPPSRAYRLRRFVRKHRGAVVAASLVLLALLGGIAGTTWGLIRADRARAAEAMRVTERDAALGEADKALKNEAERVKERDAAVQVADKRADDLKYRLGVSEFLLASAAYEDRDVVLAADRLDNVPPEQRGWEWHYLKRLTRGGLFTLYGHTGPVMSAAFSLDGTRIVTGSVDNTAKVWDARTGLPQLELRGHTGGESLGPGSRGGVCSASFSPDGTRIVTGGGAWNGPGEAKVWDARTGAPLLELKGHKGGVLSVSFSPDGTRIVTGSHDKTAKVWDARTGKPLLDLQRHRNAVTGAAFSPDGIRIVTSTEWSAKVWDARTGAPLFELKGHPAGVNGAAFSPDETRIVTAGAEGTPKVWDARTGRALLDLKGHSFAVMSAAFSPDGTRILTSSHDKTAKVWDARTGSPLLDLKGHTKTVMSASFSPDGTRIVTGSEDGTAKIWDVWTETSGLDLKGHKSQVTTATFSPDGTRILTGSTDKTAKVWDARTGSPLLELKGHKLGVLSASFSTDGTRIVTSGGERYRKLGEAKVWDAQMGSLLLDLRGLADEVTSASFSPDSTRIVTGSIDRTAKVWDARTGTPLLDLKGHRLHVRSVAFSPDGTRFLTGGGFRDMPGGGYQDIPGEARVWDARTGSPLLDLKGHTGGVLSASFSPDGSRIVTSSTDRTAKVWDARTGTPLLDLKGHSSGVSSASFSPDGSRIVSGSRDHTVKVWDARTGTPLLELKSDPGWISSASFSPDGTRIVTGGGAWNTPGEAKVWDARTGSSLLELKGHTGGVRSVSFSPDGTRIVTGSDDRSAKVWDARTGTLLLDLKNHADEVASVAFSPDGTRIITVSPDETTKVWDARTGQELKGEPSPPAPRPSPISPDGRWIAHPTGSRVELIPLQPDAEELEYRRILMKPNLWRYREGYDAARKAQDQFAARFYLDRLPLPERTQLETTAAAEREIAEGRTQNAIGHLVTLSAADLDDTYLAMQVAALQAWFGQEKELADTCARALDFAKGNPDPSTAGVVARICCLRPMKDKARLESALALARKVVELGRDQTGLNDFQLTLLPLTLGMAEYRNGHFAGADTALIAAANVGKNYPQVLGTSAFYRAMSLFRQGKENAARQLVTEAASKMKPLPKDEKNPLADHAINDDLILWMAYKEARALIKFETAPAAPVQSSKK